MEGVFVINYSDGSSVIRSKCDRCCRLGQPSLRCITVSHEMGYYEGSGYLTDFERRQLRDWIKVRGAKEMIPVTEVVAFKARDAVDRPTQSLVDYRHLRAKANMEACASHDTNITRLTVTPASLRYHGQRTFPTSEAILDSIENNARNGVTSNLICVMTRSSGTQSSICRDLSRIECIDAIKARYPGIPH